MNVRFATFMGDTLRFHELCFLISYYLFVMLKQI